MSENQSRMSFVRLILLDVGAKLCSTSASVPCQWDVALSAQPTTQVLFGGECLKAGTHHHHKHTPLPTLVQHEYSPTPVFLSPLTLAFLNSLPFYEVPADLSLGLAPGQLLSESHQPAGRGRKQRIPDDPDPFVPSFPSHSFICSTPHPCLPWVKRELRPERTDWFFLFLYEINLVWLQEIETVFICSPIHIFHESPLLGKKSNPVKRFLPALYWCKYLPRHIITQNNSQWN